MTNPGAVRSGFCLPSRVGPRLLKEDIFPTCPALPPSFVSKDPTAITFSAFAGSLIVPDSVAVGKNTPAWAVWARTQGRAHAPPVPPPPPDAAEGPVVFQRHEGIYGSEGGKNGLEVLFSVPFVSRGCRDNPLASKGAGCQRVKPLL